MDPFPAIQDAAPQPIAARFHLKGRYWLCISTRRKTTRRWSLRSTLPSRDLSVAGLVPMSHAPNFSFKQLCPAALCNTSYSTAVISNKLAASHVWSFRWIVLSLQWRQQRCLAQRRDHGRRAAFSLGVWVSFMDGVAFDGSDLAFAFCRRLHQSTQSRERRHRAEDTAVRGCSLCTIALLSRLRLPRRQPLMLGNRLTKSHLSGCRSMWSNLRAGRAYIYVVRW